MLSTTLSPVRRNGFVRNRDTTLDMKIKNLLSHIEQCVCYRLALPVQGVHIRGIYTAEAGSFALSMSRNASAVGTVSIKRNLFNCFHLRSTR